jgi:aspartate/methionine/tyrosine aminotransferase
MSRPRSIFNQRTELIDFSKIRVYSSLAAKIPGAIDLTLGEPDFDTPRHIRSAAEDAIEQGFTHYTPTAGIAELRQAICDKLRNENGITADPNSQVLVTVGASEGIMLTMQGLLNEGDEVLVPDPGFDMYTPNILLAGAKPVPLPLAEPEFTVDEDVLRSLVTDRTKMIVLNSPSNPTGAVLGRDEMKKVIDVALENELYILSDEVYEAVMYDGLDHFSPASSPECFPRCVSLYSFSKTYAMTGWRVGYVVAPAELTTKFTKLHRNIVAHPTSISQRAALAALTGSQECVAEMVREFDRRRLFVLSRLEKLGIACSRPRGAFYLFPDTLRLGENASVVAEELAQRGVVTVPGSAFGSSGEGHLRVSYAASMSRLERAMGIFATWAKEKAL